MSASSEWRLGMVQTSLVALAMQDFAFQIIAHVTDGGALDDAALAIIRATCVRTLKNADLSGVTIEQQAEIFGKAVHKVEEFIDDAIRRGRQPQQP